MQEGLKQEIINAETEYAVLYNEAVKAKYKLTKDEEKDARSQAKKAVKGLSFVQKLQLNISEKKLSKRFEKRILADRYKADQKKTTDATVTRRMRSRMYLRRTCVSMMYSIIPLLRSLRIPVQEQKQN